MEKFIGRLRELLNSYEALKEHHKDHHYGKPVEPMMPCGHPRGCVISAPSAPGMDTTCHCGWCTAEAERDALREKLKAAQGLAEALEAEHQYVNTKIEAIGHGQEVRYNAELSDVLRRYSKLVWMKKKQALSAWKVANDELS